MTLDVAGIGMTSERTRLRLLERLRQAGITDELVLEAMLRVPRHLFVDEALGHRAYEDTALPIGFGQTISQPYIVARMTAALLAGGPGQRILEVGAGSGYQAALLSELAEKVVTIERIPELQRRAQKILHQLQCHNVTVLGGNGAQGSQKHAPFDGIIVTAAPTTVPQPLLSQLASGGRLVIPVGENQQELKVITRNNDEFRQFTLEIVKFVPLIDD